jgi:hypothetical protein
MSTYDLPQEPELMVKSRQAAFCASRSLAADDLTPMDIDDMIQSAALAFWKYSQRGQPVPYCFVAARNGAKKCYYRQILGHGPLNTLSLDTMEQDSGDHAHYPAEWLVASPAGDDTRSIDWLSDACPDRQGGEVLEGVLYEARCAAGYSQRKLTRHWQTLQTDKQIIRLAANGHTNASFAELMGTTEGTIRPLTGICENRRQRIRRLLESLLPLGTVVECDRSGGTHQSACEIQSTYAGRRRPERT